MSAKITIATHLLNGRRVGKIADLKTLGNDETITSIHEAKEGLYVVGDEQFIKGHLGNSMDVPLRDVEDDIPHRSAGLALHR